MSRTVSNEVLQPLTDAIVDRPPYVSGTLSLPLDCFNLFYKTANGSSYLNFTTATEAELSELAAACEASTFSKNKQYVSDESCRRAGKMDIDQFSSPIVPERTPLVQAISDELLERENSTRRIRLELCQLNVYCEGSFFEPHVDAPCSMATFGYLVLVFPTQYESGPMILRHGGKEWTFDPENAFGRQSACSVGFIAFYSDVEHEASRVRSGHLVTLTYSLHLEDIAVEDNRFEVDAQLMLTVAPNGLKFDQMLSEMLCDPSFLPDGGLLGFGLQHKYPVEWNLEHVHKLLKGSDAIIWRTSERLSLKPTLYFFHEGKYWFEANPYEPSLVRVLFRKAPPFIEGEVDTDGPNIISDLKEMKGTIVIERVHTASLRSSRSRACVDEVDEPVVPVSWVTDRTSFTALKTTYTEHNYKWSTHNVFNAEVCLIVRVTSFEERRGVRGDEELKG